MHVDGVMNVEVQECSDVKVRRAHVCGHLQGNRERPRFLEQLVHLLKDDYTGNPRVLGDRRVAARADAGQSTTRLGGKQHASCLAEGKFHTEVVNF